MLLSSNWAFLAVPTVVSLHLRLHVQDTLTTATTYCKCAIMLLLMGSHLHFECHSQVLNNQLTK